MYALRPETDGDINIENICLAFSNLVENGKAKAWGMYGWFTEEVKQAHEFCKTRGIRNLTLI